MEKAFEEKRACDLEEKAEDASIRNTRRRERCPFDGLVCDKEVCDFGYDDGVCRVKLKIGSHGVCPRYKNCKILVVAEVGSS